MRTAHDVCHNCLLSTIGPEALSHWSALFDHLPPSFISTQSIVMHLAGEVV